MSKKLTFILAVLVGSAPVLFSQVILPVNDRDSLLADMQAVIGNTAVAPQAFTGITSPFMEKKQTMPNPQPQTGNQTVEPQREPSRELSDTAALRLVSQQFKPLGSLVLGNRGILQLANGNTIEKGASFKAEIQGRSYEVTIAEVTQNGYTLRLGSAVLDQTFLKK
jgi:hypothetical protein